MCTFFPHFLRWVNKIFSPLSLVSSQWHLQLCVKSHAHAQDERTEDVDSYRAHITIPFPLLEGLCHNLYWSRLSEVHFHCQRSYTNPFRPQLRRSAIQHVAHRLFNSSPSLFPAGSTVERGKHILTSRTSGAISPRHCEQPNYLDLVSSVCQTNKYSQFTHL